MRVIDYLFGECRLRLTGASPQLCLNLFSAEGIAFWDIVREDDLHYCVSMRPRAVKAAQRLALRAYCTAEVRRERGLLRDLKKLRGRPVLLLGLPAALAAGFVFQSFVWSVEVQGNERVHPQTVVRALQELGVGVGTWAPSIDCKGIKNPLLNLVPELSWAAVNRSGGKLTVLVSERSRPEQERPIYSAGNIVAAQDGVLTEVSVLEGMRLCKVGDTVRKGQVLVSGFEDYGLCLKGVCAQAEIYGQTWHSMLVVTPLKEEEKRYTGREWTQRTLIVGRKRINLSGNSRISVDNCDKMITEKKLSLPGYDFPVTLETATYREYETVLRSVWEPETLLEQAFRRMTLGSMVAGKIESESCAVTRTGELCVLRGEATCTEMLARLVPMNAIYEGESYDGTDHKRGTN